MSNRPGRNHSRSQCQLLSIDDEYVVSSEKTSISSYQINLNKQIRQSGPWWASDSEEGPSEGGMMQVDWLKTLHVRALWLS